MNTYTYLLFEDLIDKTASLGKAYYYKVELPADDTAIYYGVYLGDCFAMGKAPDTEIGTIDFFASEYHYDNKTPLYSQSYDFSKFLNEFGIRSSEHKARTGEVLDAEQIYEDLEEQAFVGFIMKDGAPAPLFMNSFFKSTPKKKTLFKRK